MASEQYSYVLTETAEADIEAAFDYIATELSNPEAASSFADELIEKLEELKKTIGIPASIKEWGIKEEDFLATLDEMTENAFNDQCTGANPRYPLMSEIKELYLMAYYGKDTREAAML